MVEPSMAAEEGSVALVVVGIAERLATLMRSLEAYELLSNGVRGEVRQITDRIATDGDDAAVAAVAAAIEHVLDDGALADMWHQIVKVFRHRRLEPVLSLHGLPYPRYPVGEQEAAGEPRTPSVKMWDPPPVPETSPSAWSVLGYDIGFPIGSHRAS